MEFVNRLIYRLGLRKKYARIDRVHYLKRLAKADPHRDPHYVSGHDASQFVPGAKVLIAEEFRGRRVLFMCDPSKHFERKIIAGGFAGHPVLDYMATYADDETIVLDVGANVGPYCGPLATARRDLVVYAFEPNPDVAGSLRANIRLNRLSNVRVVDIAASDTRGSADFFKFDLDIGLSSLNLRAAEIHGKPTTIQVKTDTLDTLLAERERRVSFLKIDVQGHELAVLRGAKTILTDDRPVVLFEHEDPHFESAAAAQNEKSALRELFGAAGYQCFYLTRKDARLLFAVDWTRPLLGDVLAIPDASDERISLRAGLAPDS